MLKTIGQSVGLHSRPADVVDLVKEGVVAEPVARLEEGVQVSRRMYTLQF